MSARTCNTMIALLGLAFSGMAAAEDAKVDATKSAQPEVIAKAYGSLYMRHATLDKYAADGSDNVVPALVIIPTLGTHLFNDKLDVAYSWYFKKTASSNRINKVVSYAELTYSIIDNDTISLYPYVYIEQANGESFSIVDAGPHMDVKWGGVQTPVGKLSAVGFLEPLVEYTSGHSAAKAPVIDRTTRNEAQALTDGSPAPSPAEKEIEQRDPSISSTTEVAAKLAVDAVKGLSFGAGVDYLQNWAPKYEAKTEDSDVRYSKAGYSVKSAVMNKVSVSYKLTDAVSLSNQLRYMVNGAWNDSYTTQGVSGVSARIENRLALNATLF
jgi:hypothetical protein